MKCVILSILFVMMFVCQGNAEQTLKMHSGDICPFQCIPTEADNRRGLINDITHLIFTEAGYEIIPIYVPFVRAIKMSQAGEIDIMATIFKNEIPNLFYPNEHVAIAREVFFKKKTNHWKYDDIRSLDLISRKRQIIITKGYDYGSQQFKAYMADNPDKFQILYGEDIFERAIQMLILERAKIAIFDQSVVSYTMGLMGVSDDFEIAGALHEGKKLYIGISVKNPSAQKLIEIFDSKLKKLKSNGTYQKIMAQYNLLAFE